MSEVGEWAKEKHSILSKYIDISHATRKKYLTNPDSPDTFKGGAVYIDLFCGPGRSVIKNTNEIIDGSPIIAWKESQKRQSEFTKVFIADADIDNLTACKARLKKLGAEVYAFHGDAFDALVEFESQIGTYSLNFCFIDPYNLKSLQFNLIEKLTSYKRMDIIIHLSKMDLQRNLKSNLKHVDSDFDSFIPGWRERFDLNRNYHNIRQQAIDYWIEKVTALDTLVSSKADWKLITGPKNIPLYWLMLIAKNELASKFWKEINKSAQSGFDF